MLPILLLLYFAGAAGCAPAMRVVSAAPSVTEMLFALGVGDNVVGVTDYCRYPPEASKRTHVGTYLQPNLETIASLRPSLVIIEKNPLPLASKLQQMGFHVLEIDDLDIAGMLHSIEQIGQAVNAPVQAAKLTAFIRGQLEAIGRRAAAFSRRRVTFVIGRSPDALEGIVAVGGNHSYLSDILALAGGYNIFGATTARFPAVSLEEILNRRPEVIIDMGDMGQTMGVTEAHKRSVVKLWSRYPDLPAVREHSVFAVASDIFVVPGPRVVDAAREFFRMIHPEAKP